MLNNVLILSSESIALIQSYGDLDIKPGAKCLIMGDITDDGGHIMQGIEKAVNYNKKIFDFEFAAEGSNIEKRWGEIEYILYYYWEYKRTDGEFEHMNKLHVYLFKNRWDGVLDFSKYLRGDKVSFAYYISFLSGSTYEEGKNILYCVPGMLAGAVEYDLFFKETSEDGVVYDYSSDRGGDTDLKSELYMEMKRLMYAKEERSDAFNFKDAPYCMLGNGREITWWDVDETFNYIGYSFELYSGVDNVYYQVMLYRKISQKDSEEILESYETEDVVHFKKSFPIGSYVIDRKKFEPLLNAAGDNLEWIDGIADVVGIESGSVEISGSMLDATIVINGVGKDGSKKQCYYKGPVGRIKYILE